MDKMGFDTLAVRGGYGLADGLRYNNMVVPIHQSAVYPFESAEYAEKLFKYEVEGFVYGRIDNPTCKVFESRMAQLEGCEAALGTATGMAAIFMVAIHLAQTGDEIVCSNRVYGGTFELFDVTLPKMGIKVHFVENPEDISSWEKAITSKTRLLYVESPSNPNLFVADIPALSALARSKGIPLMVDNTICTPALMKPFELGADIVIHSATKYISGNATTISGVICGKEDFITTIRRDGYRNIGPSLSPFNAWLCLMGLETLSLRMERHTQNALAVAQFLESHPKVSKVNYPGLNSHPQYELARRQMKGCSSLMCFDIKGTIEDVRKFINALKLCVHTTHLGSSITVICHPASTTHEQLGEEKRHKAGIGETMLRLSVGLENAEDIIADLDQALTRV